MNKPIYIYEWDILKWMTLMNWNAVQWIWQYLRKQIMRNDINAKKVSNEWIKRMRQWTKNNNDVKNQKQEMHWEQM